MVLCITSDGLGRIWFCHRKRIKIKNLHPKNWTNENIETMKAQPIIRSLIDWDLEILTCDKIITSINKKSLLIFTQGLGSRKETYTSDQLKKLYY